MSRPREYLPYVTPSRRASLILLTLLVSTFLTSAAVAQVEYLDPSIGNLESMATEGEGVTDLARISFLRKESPNVDRLNHR